MECFLKFIKAAVCHHLNKKIGSVRATSYPPMDYTTVLSAMQSLTTEFGMGSGVTSAP